MKTLSYTEKLNLFENNKYHCQVPPVLTANWPTASWIQWIDSTGKWEIEKEEIAKKEKLKHELQTNSHKHMPSL